MSPSALGSVAPTPAQAPASRGEAPRADREGFARMLQGAPAPEASGPAPDPTVQAQSRGPGQRQDRPAADDDAPDRAQDPAATSAATTETADADTATEQDKAPGDGTWPPPGLGWLMQLPEPAPVAERSQPGAAAGATDPRGGGLLRPAGLPGSADPPPVLAATAMEAGEVQLPASEDIAQAANGLRAAPVPATTENPAPAFVVLPPAPAAPATSLAPSPAASTASHLPAPDLHDAGFADDVGSHVQWAAGQKIGHAVIRISPQDLGPVEVRLHLDGDRLAADFSSAQAEVRQALEQGLPRLREMLGAHGFELAHAGVGHDPSRERGQAPGGPANTRTETASEAEPVLPVQAPRHRGLLDAYA